MSSMEMVMNAKAIGWTRATDPRGRVLRYHLRTISNCITQFAGTRGGYKDKETHMCNTSPYLLIEYDPNKS